MASSKLSLVAALEGHTERVWCVAWSPDGSVLASCSGDKTIRLWIKLNDKWLAFKVLEGVHDSAVRRIGWSPDGRHIAAACFDKTCSVWGEQSGEWKMVATLEGHENEVKCASFSPSGALVATCARDKTVWIWAMDTKKESFECISVCTGHQQDVKSVKWHPNSQKLASASYDDTIKIWEQVEADWRNTHTLSLPAVEGAGKAAITASSGTDARGEIAGHTSTVWDLCWSPSGDELVSCSDDKTVIVWKFASGTWGIHQKIVTGNRRPIYSVDWSRDGVLTFGGGDNVLEVYKKDAKGNFHSISPKTNAHTSDVNSVAWNPKTPELLASGSDDNLVKIWSLT